MASFHSVQDAVKLFNAGLYEGKHNKSQEQEVLVEETNLCLWNKEVNKLKEKIKKAEMTKVEALLELDEAKKTVEHLSRKLGIRENMRTDVKALDLCSSNVTSELGIAKELLERLAEGESQLGSRQNMSSNVRVVTSELGFAKESLHRVAEEESELCMLMESLKLELQNVKEEHSQLKEIEQQRETDQSLEELKKEAEDAKTELLMLEEELKIALFEAEESKAKAAKEHAVERLKSGSKVLAEKKESGASELTETEALLRACRDETLKQLEMSEREIQDIKAATQAALKKAEMAKQATIVVDAELKRRRKAASRILAQSKIIAKSFPSAKEVHKSKSRSKETCLVKC